MSEPQADTLTSSETVDHLINVITRLAQVHPITYTTLFPPHQNDADGLLMFLRGLFYGLSVPAEALPLAPEIFKDTCIAASLGETSFPPGKEALHEEHGALLLYLVHEIQKHGWSEIGQEEDLHEIESPPEPLKSEVPDGPDKTAAKVTTETD